MFQNTSNSVSKIVFCLNVVLVVLAIFQVTVEGSRSNFENSLLGTVSSQIKPNVDHFRTNWLLWMGPRVGRRRRSSTISSDVDKYLNLEQFDWKIVPFDNRSPDFSMKYPYVMALKDDEYDSPTL